MNVLQNLIELYDILPQDSTYRKVVKSILLNMDDAASETIYGLADLSDSSRTTVWRMLRMLGYDRYSDFSYALKKADKNYTYYNRMISAEMAGKDVIGSILGEVDSMAATVREDLDEEMLEKLAERVDGMKQVFFFFPYQTASISSFQQNLSMAGIETDVVCLLPDMREVAQQASKDTMVFSMTIEHAEAQDMTDVFRTLHEKGAYTLLFSDFETRYDQYINKQLCVHPKSDSAMASVLRYDIFIFALSEIFRRDYLSV